MTSNTAPYLKVKNIATYIDQIKARDNTHWIVKPSGDHVYLSDGKEIPGNEFEANNPIPQLEKVKSSFGYQLDGRTNWID